jgi:hypothetical protein
MSFLLCYKDVATYKEFESHAHMVMDEPGWEEVAGYVEEWIRGV